MAEAEKVKKVSTKTEIALGAIHAPIGLYKATVDPKSTRKWESEPDEGETGPAEPLASGKRKSKSRPASPPAAKAEPKKKGIIKEDGKWVDLTEQIEQIGEDSKVESMQVVSFMNRRQIPTERITATYYVGTTDYDPTERPDLYPPARLLALLFRAMREQDAVAIVKWSKLKGQTVGVMSPHSSGALIVRELAFAENWRLPHERCLTHQHIEVEDSEIEAACGLIDAMAGKRSDLDDIRDRRKQLEDELVTRAELGELDEWTLPDRSEEADEAVAELGELVGSVAE